MGIIPVTLILEVLVLGVYERTIPPIPFTGIFTYFWCMPEVIDVVTRLTYELQDKGLTEAANALGQQIKQLSILQQEEKKLQANRSNDLAQQKQQEAQLAKNRQSQQALTQEIRKSVANNRQLIATMNQEIGLLGKIGDRIKDLKRYREDAHKSEIAGINQEIRLLEQKRRAISEQGVSGGFLSGLLPEGKLSTQIGQGLLYGLGIGTGFGLITRAVSELVDTLSQLAGAIFNTVDYQKQLAQSSESVANAVKSEIKALNDLNMLYQSIDFEENSTRQIMRNLEAIKARGIVRGQVFQQEKQIFEGEQALRNAELGDLQNAQKSYKQIADILKVVSGEISGGNVQGYFKLVERVRNKGAKSNDEVIEGIFQDPAIVGDIPKEILDRIRLSIEGKTGTEMKAAIRKTLNEISKEQIALKEDEKDKTDEIANAQIQRTAELANEQYQIERGLLIKIRGANAEASAEKIKILEEEDRVTVDRIKQRTAILRNEQLAQVKDREEQARKETALTLENEQRFAAERAAITKKFRQQENAEIAQYYRQRVVQAISLSDTLSKEQLSASQQELQLLQTTTDDTLQKRQEIAAKTTEVELNEVHKRYDALIKAAYKSGNDTTELTEEYIEQIRLVELRGQQRGIQAYEDYYTDRIGVLREYQQDEQGEIEGNANALEETYRQQYEDGEIGLRKYLRKRKQIQYQEDLDLLNQRKENLQQELNLAREAERRLENDPNATDRQRRQARRRVTSLGNRLDTTNQEISTTAGAPGGVESFLFGDTALIKDKGQRIREEIQLTASAYGDLASSAIGAFQQIYAHQQELLDREISIREKRLDVAVELAKRGNTEVLKIEQERLDESVRKQAEYTRKQQILNSLLALSQSIVAVTNAAAQSGVGAIVTVPAVIAAIIAGITTVSAITKQSTMEGFAEGVEDYQGKGTGTSDSNTVRISRGESILTAKATRDYSGIPTMMNNGTFPKFSDVSTWNNNSGVSMKETNKKLDSVIDRLSNLEFRAENKLDANGASQMVEAYSRKQQANWRNA